ncbi:MAG: galactokinase [Gemmatimonadaceae bacterium]
MNYDEASTFFTSAFGGEPDVIASSAGRVNLIGEHVDYNGGQVLPMAIERRTWVAARAASGKGDVLSGAASANEPLLGEFDARHPLRAGHWWDYVAGVADALNADGVQLPQFEIAVVSDVPQGAGLSSSAALEVATATALCALAGSNMDAKLRARAAWRAETQFVGVPCGIMDQFASALGQSGHALHIWCDTGDTEQVPFTEAVLIFDTAVPRSLRASAFEQRRAECDEALRLLRVTNPSLPNLASATPEQIVAAQLPDPLGRRALHVSEETRRVERAVAALKTSGTIPGELLLESHESLRLLFQCSTPELDWFVEHAMRIEGVRGARLTGAGWGGCAIAIGDVLGLRRAAEELPSKYKAEFGLVARTWLTAAAAGTHVDSSHD